MNTKMKMRMLSILLCFVMLVGLMPTTVLAAEKNQISEVEATATLPDKLYVGMNLYDPNLLETISFNITKGAPAKLAAESPWMYYNEETGYYERIYQNDDARIVKAGVRYAYAAQLRIDGVDYETNTLAHHVDVKINGVLWNTSEDPYEGSTVTYTWTQSPDFAVSSEPYRQKISRISATVNDYQNTYFYGDPIVLPSSYTVTMGIPAKFDDTTDVWQKKNGDTWEDCTENTFKGGTYRLKVKLVVDGEDNDTHYLNDGIWGVINGTTMSSRYWHSLDTPTHTANSSYVWMVSPEHKIEGPAGYTVAFDANGGTGNMASVNNVSGNYTLPPNGFTPPANKQFKCWSVNGNEKNPFESISVTADVTVKAVWKDIVTTSYTVSFNSNGGSGSMASVTNAPSLYTLPDNGFTPPANQQFKCWAVGAQNDEYDPGDQITITADVTVKAVWETITSSRQVISDVVAISSDLDTIPTLYGLLKIPTFTVTQGAPAYINATTSNLRWQKKVEGVWTNQDSGRFTPGEWRISSSLRISGTEGYYYELGNPTTLTVNGQAWTVENNGKPSVHPDYSHANILSPVFTIVDDPNVQPPVPVESVHMVLNGYTPDAAAASATVTTDANVTVEVLGFLEGIDSNGDGQPDTTKPVTGNFASGKLYVVGLKIKAKSGYDISGLTAQNVSLDRAIMDMFEENVIDDETFSGMYMLGDAMQYTVTYDANGGTGSMAQEFLTRDNEGFAKNYTFPQCGFTAPAGQEFDKWLWYYESDPGKTNEITPGNSPWISGNIVVKALWKTAEYNVTVTGGTASVGAGTPITKATMGTTVTLTAGAAPTGQMFEKWVVNGATVADSNSATTTFVMPAGNVTATATYKNIPGGNHPVTIAMKDGDDITTAYTQAQFVALQALAAKGLLVEDSQVNGYRNNAGKLLFTINNNTLIDLQEGLTEQDYIHYTLTPQEVAEIKAYIGEDITEIHLIFLSKCVVSFDANGGTGTMADVTGISGEYTLPENGFTAPDGKQFKAWRVDGNEKTVGDKITVTADTTVTAVWETIPAGHTCDIQPVQKVEPSCTEGGKEAYYKCEGCGKFYEDALGTKEITDLAAWGNLAKLGHIESDWKSDKDNHWKECTVAGCGVIIENSKAAHADANNDGKCDICEYNVGKTSTNPGNKPSDDTTKPGDTNKPSDDVQSPQTGDNSLMWLWIALLFVSGFGIVTTAVYDKKRKSVK